MPEDNQQQPVVIKQGGGTGIGLVLAALILGGALVYAVTIWSNTQKNDRSAQRGDPERRGHP